MPDPVIGARYTPGPLPSRPTRPRTRTEVTGLLGLPDDMWTDTKRWFEHNPSGAQLTFSSPRHDPSYVSVPLRKQ